MYQVSCSTSASVVCFPRWEPAQGHTGTSAQINAIWHVSFPGFDLVCVNLRINWLFTASVCECGIIIKLCL